MQALKQKLIDVIQQDIPIQENPFQWIAEQLNMDLDNVFELLKALKQEGILRQIAPIYDTKSLGYQSGLVAVAVEDNDIEKAVYILNEHPGVSHNYLRNDTFNIWFTIAIPPDSRIGLEETIKILIREIGTDAKYVILNTKRVFKINTRFMQDAKEMMKREDFVDPKIFSGRLDEIDKYIIRETQYDLPIVDKPFHDIANRLDLGVDILIKKLSKYKEQGIMRRFSGLINHRKAGFNANGMSVWIVPEDKIEEYGKIMASFKGVTHCYERTTNEFWHYNLFCMIHGKDEKEVYDTVYAIQQALGDEIPFKVLFSSKEFKKTRLRYFEDDYYRWEDRYI
jgi:DNA-binding Lrp family transcriptional regulator